MTLKEKFLQQKVSVLFTENSIPTKVHANMDLRSTEDLEQIAEEFAIGFGQWLVSNCYSEDDIYWWLIKTNGDVRKSTKELLEIYKKEKGL